MKNYVIILVGIIIALLIVGGSIAYISMQDNAGDNNNTTITNSTITNTTNDNPNATIADKNNTTSSEPYVVSEVVKFNAQEGEGYYREVTYSDGNFRQYDVDTGKLIGSSYDSDQDKLPSVE